MLSEPLWILEATYALGDNRKNARFECDKARKGFFTGSPCYVSHSVSWTV